MKKVIRLTESDLHNIIKKSVNRIIKESWAESNDAKYREAVEILSQHILNWFDEEEILRNPDCVEQEVKDCWQDALSDDLIEAIYDKADVASITDRNMYGGGSFEVMRGLECDVRDNVLNILQNGQNN